MQVIIFSQGESNRVSVVTPAPEFSNQIEAIAVKDVPAGRPWRIVDAESLPPTESRDLWRWTASGPLAIADPPTG